MRPRVLGVPSNYRSEPPDNPVHQLPSFSIEPLDQPRFDGVFFDLKLWVKTNESERF